MRVVNMLVEGMTEHQFVGQVLKPYLMNFEVFVVPTIVKTKHTHQGTWAGQTQSRVGRVNRGCSGPVPRP